MDKQSTFVSCSIPTQIHVVKLKRGRKGEAKGFSRVILFYLHATFYTLTSGNELILNYVDGDQYHIQPHPAEIGEHSMIGRR